MYAIFENDGVLDFRAMTVMGINAKPTTDSPIGFFGTGMKYAIAVLARLGCELRVQDGCGMEYIVQPYDSMFRDKQFQMLRLVNTDDERDYIELPFTTELGKQWKPWMVLRELECNARDEKGSFRTATAKPKSAIDTVRFIVSGISFTADIHDMRRATFFDVANERKDVSSLSNIEFVNKQSTSIYMQNIRVQEFEKQFHFTYNIVGRLDLTEDRTLKYIWEIDGYIKELFYHGPEWYRHALLNDENALEWKQIDYSQSERDYPATVIAEIELHWDRGGWLPEPLKQMIMNKRVREAMDRSRDLDENESMMLNEACERLELLGYDIRKFKIINSATLPRNVLGIANHAKKSINIAQTNYELGLECLMGTLLEEFLHLEYSFTDLTRQFQDYLLRQTIVNGQRYLRRRYGEGPLAEMESRDAPETFYKEAPREAPVAVESN